VQDNSLSIFRLLKLQEVHKIILLSGHSYALGVLGINNAFYIQLSEDERAAVDAAASKAIAFNRESSHKAGQEALPALRAAGVEFIELSPEQKEKFQTTIQGSIIHWLRTRINAPSLIDEVLLAAQEAR
jgi:TRAP-type C4-dicarboxylate transport system substrate-binding protein